MLHLGCELLLQAREGLEGEGGDGDGLLLGLGCHSRRCERMSTDGVLSVGSESLSSPYTSVGYLHSEN